ncbi:MAG: DUF1573 domain-containing protein [bacterium]
MQKKGFIFIVIIILAVFVGVGYFLSNVSDQYSGPPVLTVSEELGDLGKIKPDEKQTHVFTLKNDGGETLVIERVQAPCGCTATLLSDEEILSGNTAQLEVTFNPRGYEGEVTQSVYIYSNDPEIQRKRIAIRADVEHVAAPEAKLSTNLWEIGLLARGDSVEIAITVSNQGDLGMEIESIDVPDHIHYQPQTVEFPKSLAPEEEIEFNFTYDSTEHEIGVVREYIRMVTTDPRRKNITLRIEGYITEKENVVSIYPIEYISITGDSEEETQEARYVLKNNSEKTLQLVSVESSVDYLEPISQEMILSPGEERDIVIRIKPENITDLYIGEKIQEYIYLNIALPISISPEPQ